jgi:hypothetical protein
MNELFLNIENEPPFRGQGGQNKRKKILLGGRGAKQKKENALLRQGGSQIL